MATKIGTAKGETLIGTSQADIIGGRGGHDTIDGRGGHDRLYGDDGNDRILGGPGNDLLMGSTGNDSLDGGDGDDTLNGQEGKDILRGGNGNDSLHSDDLSYSGLVDLIYAGPGHDLIAVATSGIAYGGDGDDRISICNADAYGEGGRDTILPYTNCDTDGIGYSEGSATVRGGPGADTLVFDTPVCGALHMTFLGWEPGVDMISGQLMSWDFAVGDALCWDAIPVPLGGVREYLLRNFDTNKDKHISKADGPTFLANGNSLTFPVNPLTGKQSLLLEVSASSLYLPDVTTLF